MALNDIWQDLRALLKGIRTDILTSLIRLRGFLYTTRVRVKIRCSKVKRQAKKFWRGLWQ